MRIGTWNLEGRWSSHHQALLVAQECDVWLLTEVSPDASIPGMTAHRTAQAMGPRKTWAGIFTKLDVVAQPDPHRATAMVLGDGFRLMSSVLPWRTCGHSWEGATLAERMRNALSGLRKHIDETTVWGGDWNQALEGREYVGTLDGRKQILTLVTDSLLSVPTTTLSSTSPGHRSIDHIALPIRCDVNGANRVRGIADGHRLSDHDAYVVAFDR